MKTEPEKPFSFELQTDVHWLGQDVVQYLVYASEFESMLTKGHKELEEEISAKLKNATKVVQDELVDGYAWDLSQSASFFPQLHRESLFLTLYNYLEHSLNTTCHQIGREIGTDVQLSDINGNGVNRALLYLRRIPEFSFSKVSAEVGFIRKANMLRNVVVHNGSILLDNEKHLANVLVKAESTLSGKPGGPVSFDAEFLPLFGERIRSIFDEIGNEMQRYMGKRCQVYLGGRGK